MSADRHAFLNRVRSLHCIDRGELPELDWTEWRLFQDNPADYLLRTDDTQAAAIWREVEKRQAVRA